MKKVLFSIGLMVASLSTDAQSKVDTNQNKEPVFSIVEQMPEFPGGDNELNKFLVDNLHYPKQALNDRREARAIFRFVVNEDGSISSIESKRPVGFEFEQEGIRVIKMMPKWKPGKQNGKAIRVFFTLPMNFTLN
jgi:protein TonB